MDYVLYTPISKILKGIIAYFHPTLFGLKQTPTSETDQVSAIAGLYVTSGYAILFIDYLGYSKEEGNPHPYVQYPNCNTLSAILALNKALKKLKE